MPTERSDIELMAAFQRGEAAAFEELVERHHRGLIHFFCRMTADRAQAEDWAQEVFIRIVKHARSYEPRAKFTTFLYRIARNLWIDAMRERSPRPRPASLDGGGDGESGAGPGDWVAASTPTPPETLVREEVGEGVRRAIDRLPEEQRMVVLLSELQGLKYAEIGEALDIPVGTVKSRMHAAVQRLKELLAPLAEDSRQK